MRLGDNARDFGFSACVFPPRANAIELRRLRATRFGVPKLSFGSRRPLVPIARDLLARFSGRRRAGRVTSRASMTWHLRQDLPAVSVSLNDADALANATVQRLRGATFLIPNPTNWCQSLNGAQGDMYESGFQMGDHSITLPGRSVHVCTTASHRHHLRAKANVACDLFFTDMR